MLEIALRGGLDDSTNCAYADDDGAEMCSRDYGEAC